MHIFMYMKTEGILIIITTLTSSRPKKLNQSVYPHVFSPFSALLIIMVKGVLSSPSS